MLFFLKFSCSCTFFALFFAVSCDSGVKFNNPNDINSDAYQGDSDQNTPADDSEPADDTDVSDSDTSDADTTDLDSPYSDLDYETTESNCSPKPAHFVWNDDGRNGKFTQIWDGENWLPETYESTYGITAGT